MVCNSIFLVPVFLKIVFQLLLVCNNILLVWFFFFQITLFVSLCSPGM